MESAKLVERGTILRATVGSTLHGLHHGGQDDRDEMAVFVEPPEYLVGLARARSIRGGLYGFEHFVERTQPEGVRSGPGDLDLRRVQPSEVRSSRPQGAPDDPAAALRSRREPPRPDGSRRGAPCAAARAPLAAGRPGLPRLPARPAGATARDARADAGQPARARRGAWLRHEVRDARSPPRVPGRRAPENGLADTPDARARAVARDGDSHG